MKTSLRDLSIHIVKTKISMKHPPGACYLLREQRVNSDVSFALDRTVKAIGLKFAFKLKNLPIEPNLSISLDSCLATEHKTVMAVHLQKTLAIIPPGFFYRLKNT